MERNGLVSALVEEQRQLGLTNAAMAIRLSISERLWLFVRSGQRVPGRRLLRAVMREFPHLHARVLDYLAQEEVS